MDKRFMAILAVIVIAFAGVLVFSKHSSNNQSSNAPATNHVEGKGSTGVTLLEYGDYQCPVCEGYYQAVKDAETRLDSQIFFQFRNLPLPSIHPNAISAARAAESASLQGKFWQMHDALYDPTNYDQWAYNTSTQSVKTQDPKPFFDQMAQSLGLNVGQFDQDYSSSKVNDSINADINAFLSTPYANHDQKKEGTPSFFINGQYVDNSNFIDSTSHQPSAAKIVSYVQNFIKNKH